MLVREEGKALEREAVSAPPRNAMAKHCSASSSPGAALQSHMEMTVFSNGFRLEISPTLPRARPRDAEPAAMVHQSSPELEGRRRARAFRVGGGLTAG